MTTTPKKRAVLTAPLIRATKNERHLTMLTAYDYTTAQIVDACEVDMLLVGDSLGMVMLGRTDTLSVTVDAMIHHCQAVVAGCTYGLVVCDMPFMSYEAGAQDAMHNAARLVREGGARALKLEGGQEIVPQVTALVQAGIPVVGHIGLTPQRVAGLGGFKVQGRGAEQAYRLFEDAKALEEAGCFSLVLEAIPAPVAKRLTQYLSIPTIGIGAGSACDGQVLVIHDMLGLYGDFSPKFAKRYANLGDLAREAVRSYVHEVQEGSFPEEKHGFTIQDAELAKLDALLEKSEKLAKA